MLLFHFLLLLAAPTPGLAFAISEHNPIPTPTSQSAKATSTCLPCWGNHSHFTLRLARRFSTSRRIRKIQPISIRDLEGKCHSSLVRRDLKKRISGIIPRSWSLG